MTIITTDVKNTHGDSTHVRYTGVVVAATSMEGAINALQQEINSISAAPPSTVPTRISAVNSPFTPSNFDFIIEVDTSAGPVAINLQAVAARNRYALAIKDATGNASTNNITINGLVDNQNPRVLRADFQAINIRPNNANTAYEELPW